MTNSTATIAQIRNLLGAANNALQAAATAIEAQPLCVQCRSARIATQSESPIAYKGNMCKDCCETVIAGCGKVRS